jgi:hypothetical protein
MHFQKSVDNLKKSIRKRLPSKRTPLVTTTNLPTEKHGAKTEHLESRDSSQTLRPEQGLGPTGDDTPVLPNPKPQSITDDMEVPLNPEPPRPSVLVHEVIPKAFASSEPPVPNAANKSLIPSERLKAPSTEETLSIKNALLIEQVCNLPDSFISLFVQIQYPFLNVSGVLRH